MTRYEIIYHNGDWWLFKEGKEILVVYDMFMGMPNQIKNTIEREAEEEQERGY
jgi:hypothetical protein